MADRISSPDENISEELPEEPKKERTEDVAKYPNAPKGYVNPFEDYTPGDEYPAVFSDIDYEIINPRKNRMFAGFEKLTIDLKTQSKSEIQRVWQYKRWKTWKYLEELPKENVVMTRDIREKPGVRGTVSINAVTYYILKGVEVRVPKDVKDMILTSQNQTALAGQKDLLSSLSQKIDPVTGLAKDQSRLER